MKSISADEVFATHDRNNCVESTGPLFQCSILIATESFDVEAECETFLRRFEVDERGTQYAFKRSHGIVERSSKARETAHELFMLMERREERAVAAYEIDVAGKACRCFFGVDVEIDLQMAEFLAAYDPGVTLGGKDRRARRIEGAQGLHEWRMLLGFGDGVEVVRVSTEIDEGRCSVGIFPGNDKDWVVG